MDGAGVLYETRDPFEIARLMAAVLDDRRIEEAILASQDAALQRLLAKDFAGTLLRHVDAVLATAPRQAPEVTWDFWGQFEQLERLEELRQFRPALFKALPLRDAGRGTRDAENSGASLPERDPAPHLSGPAPGVPDPGSRVPDRASRIPDPASRP
jgi:hypothetical protein